jgi:hypothetical protein
VCVRRDEHRRAGTEIDATCYPSDVSISQHDNQTNFLGRWHGIC